MKKKMIFIIIFILLFIPTNTFAGDVKSTSIVGKSSVEKGQEFKLTYYINFDGVNKNDAESDGVYQVAFEMIYDTSILKIKKVSAEGFETVNFSEGGSTYIISVLKENIPTKHQCIDKVLFCSSYALEVTYEVISDKATSTNVGMGDIEVIYSSMTKEDKIIYDSYLTASESTSQSSKTIKITKSETNTNNNSSTTSKKSDNAYLKKLEIEGYKFTFKKDVFEYEINIDDNVNELKVSVETEDKKATYKILGADDLKKYNNKVFITVMAEDGTTNTYTIRKQVEEEQEEKENTIVEKEEDKKGPKVSLNFKITDEHLKIAAIGIGILVGLIIIYNIIRYFIDKKIDKALDDL